MSGMDLLLTNMLKSFMPKESAEKIAGWATDGTFDRIGALPQDIAEIKRNIENLNLGLAKIFALIQSQGLSGQQILAGGTQDGISGDAGNGHLALVSSECGAAGGRGTDSGASGGIDHGNGTSAEAAE